MINKQGVLLAVSSLPGNHGVGDFGESCFQFIDWLHQNHYRYWQVLPLNPIGPGNSPYMSSCSNAIEFRYISLDKLAKEGLLNNIPTYKKSSVKVDYYKVGLFKRKYLYKAYLNFLKGNTEGFRKFKTRNPWLYQYGTFEVFKKLNNNKSWNEWNDEHKFYFEHHNNPPKTLLHKVNFEIFMQYIAYKQWKRVLSYARLKNIKIICDMPFYVGFDSVECWCNKSLFDFDKNGNQVTVGGVGPDSFSELGQLWGSPIYKFKEMEKDHYSFLINRIGHLLTICDVLRIDHFRAFDTYYVIPSEDKDARNGKWIIGPGTKFFDEFYKIYPNANLIAEDLGELRPEVYKLRDHYHLPGMNIVQFTIFDEKFIPNNNHIVYPGTHDNETLFGWFSSLKEDDIKKLMKVIGSKNKRLLYDNLFNHIVNVPSLMTIFALQDLLKLDNKARMNTPSTVNNINWTWKLKDFSFIDKIKYPKKKRK